MKEKERRANARKLDSYVQYQNEKKKQYEDTKINSMRNEDEINSNRESLVSANQLMRSDVFSKRENGLNAKKEVIYSALVMILTNQ